MILMRLSLKSVLLPNNVDVIFESCNHETSVVELVGKVKVSIAHIDEVLDNVYSAIKARCS